ncbi:hypothetical protein [Streptosporangium sandarakinum]|uniref:Integral membrane protein n=1 Tax=Streptosporangium sandarakinum TaxID=1260955 RepID=A0A852UV68_9ACTN|nr:hypothetical protein [Streptosporangium sandarakinum]NYF41212.1 hypothetical protein [Streptosporangium sandarakinum]
MFGCALTPFALAGFWVADEISGSGRYVADVAPTAADPAVRDDVADRVTAAISRSLPGMDRPATADLVRRSVNAVVTGGDFPAVWAELNRAAHRRLVSVLRDGPGRAASGWIVPWRAASGPGGNTGDTGNAWDAGDSVDLDLTPVYGMARRELAAAGQADASRLPDLHPRIELLPVRALLGARTACDWLVRLKWALPLLPLLPLAAGVVLAGDREEALSGAGFGLAASMVALAAGLAAVRSLCLPVPADGGPPSSAVYSIFDALALFPRIGLRVVFAAGLITAGVVAIVREHRSSREPPPAPDPDPDPDRSEASTLVRGGMRCSSQGSRWRHERR